MAKKLTLFIPVILFALILGAAGLMLSRGQDIHTLQSPMIDRSIPNFKSVGLSTKDIKGHAAILVFFAGWCAPCIEEHPVIVNMSDTAGVPVYGIEYKDTPAQHNAFFSGRKNPYAKIADDADGQIGLAFGVSGIPTTMVIDREGMIRYRRDMPMSEEVLKKTVLPLVRSLQ